MNKPTASLDQGFTRAPNAFLRCENISLEARALLLIIASHSDKWLFNHKHLMRVSQCSRKKFDRVLHELLDAGLLTRNRIRRGDGRLAGYTYDVCFDGIATSVPKRTLEPATSVPKETPPVYQKGTHQCTKKAPTSVPKRHPPVYRKGTV